MEKIFTLQNIFMYLIFINIITFLAMGIDKWKAKKGHWRTQEKTLLILVLLGGGIGGILSMYLFKHKTKKPQFYIGFPIIVITQTIFIILYFFSKKH